jgi:hypothetical protein
MASPKPAVIVRREFEATPDVVSQQLRACIVGPSAQLVRYGQSGEKSKGLVADLASDPVDNTATPRLRAADLLYSIPSIDYTSLLDESYCKVYVEDASLTYSHVAPTGFLLAGTFSNLATSSNSLTLVANNAWKGTGRHASIPQDVAVGDVIQLYTSSGLAHSSTVTGFDGSVVSASLGSPVTSGQSTSQSASAPSPLVLSTVTFTFSATNYLSTAAQYAADPRRVGKKSTVYTVTITGTPSASTINFTVTSDTGLDDGTFTGVATTGVAVLPSGNQLTVTFASVPTLTSALSGTMTYAAAHTPQLAGSVLTFTGTPTSTAPTTTYIFTCIAGGSFSTGNTTADFQPKFRVSTANGADIVSTITVGPTGAAVPFGSYNLSLNWTTTDATKAKGFVKGEFFTITLTGASVPYLDKVVFADPTPSTGLGIAVTYVRLSKKVGSLLLPKYWANASTPNWSITNGSDSDLRKLVIENSIRVSDPAVTGIAEGNLTAGKFYLEYRAFRELPREVGSVLSLSDITTQLGTIDPDNPLAYGVYKAWSNANGATVHYIGTVSQELNGYRGFADALALAQGNRNCYGLVPLTTSSEIWSAFAGHVKDESDPTVGRFRIFWFAPEVEQHFKSLDKDIFNADIFGVSSLHGSGKYQLAARTALGGVSSANFTQTVQPGDFVRTQISFDKFGNSTYVEYKVAAVLDNSTLLLNTTTDPLINQDRIEVYRDLTSAALAQKYVQVAGGFSSERVYAVVPDRGIDGLRVDGVPVRNWYVACAFAGLRSGSVPQQPLSNVELVGFDGLTTVDQLFDEPDLDILRDGGVWVVRKGDDGRIYSERQLSTSTLDIYRKEQSVTTNVDSIAFALADGLRNLVGRVNITEGTRGLVEATIRQILGQFTATNGAVTTGPQLLSYTLVSVTVPATAKDTLVVKIQIEVPLPMNIIDITLVI